MRVGRNLTPPPSGSEPEFIPMAVVARFFERIQMAQPRTRPKLSGALAPALACSAARFHRAAANRPPASGPRLVVHAVGVPGKIVLFPLDDFARLAPAAGQAPNLL